MAAALAGPDVPLVAAVVNTIDDALDPLQRVRSDARDKGLNALRQLIDEIYAGRFPGLFLVITAESRDWGSETASIVRARGS